MGTEKIYIWVNKANIIVLILMGPVMIIGFMYALDILFSSGPFDPLVISCLGYLFALTFGVLAQKRKIFLALSLIGWVVFGIGSEIDYLRALERNNNDTCIELRQDKNCIEKEGGSIECITGEHFGIYPQICAKL
jgi:hypothetical protein